MVNYVYWRKVSNLNNCGIPLRKIWQNVGFLRPVFSHISTEFSILFFYGKILVTENPYSGIFYAVYGSKHFFRKIE